MRIVATSDLHGELPDIPKCDLLLIAGDVCPVNHSHAPRDQYEWLKWQFNPWLRRVPAKHIVGIAGNHDFVFQKNSRAGASLDWHYLEDTSVEIEGLKIHGSPWVPQFMDWAFMKEDPALIDHWDKIPEDTDILMVHGPPRDILDASGFDAKVWDETTKEFVTQKPRVGSGSLRSHLTYKAWPNLKLVVFGHIHFSYGTMRVDDVLYVNAAHMGEDYKPDNPPIVINVLPKLDNDSEDLLYLRA